MKNQPIRRGDEFGMTQNRILLQRSIFWYLDFFTLKYEVEKDKVVKSEKMNLLFSGMVNFYLFVLKLRFGLGSID